MLRQRQSCASQGFTLIEVLITVAIIAILTAVAMPQYQDYVTRSRLANASTGLSTISAQMERYFQDNRTYGNTGSFISPCNTSAASRTFGNFVISCQTPPDNLQFTLQAVGNGPVAGFTYTINQQSVRTSTVSAAWGGATCNTKWIMKKGDSC